MSKFMFATVSEDGKVEIKKRSELTRMQASLRHRIEKNVSKKYFLTINAIGVKKSKRGKI